MISCLWYGPHKIVWHQNTIKDTENMSPLAQIAWPLFGQPNMALSEASSHQISWLWASRSRKDEDVFHGHLLHENGYDVTGVMKLYQGHSYHKGDAASNKSQGLFIHSMPFRCNVMRYTISILLHITSFHLQHFSWKILTSSSIL